MVKLRALSDDITSVKVQESFIGGAGRLQSKTATPSTESQTVAPDESYDGLNRVTVDPITSTLLESLDPDFIAGNIKKDVNLFGLIGSLSGGAPLPEWLSIEEHVHPEDWVGASAEKGSTLAFQNTYLGGSDVVGNKIYLALINNTNTSTTKGDYAYRGAWANGRSAYSFSRGNGSIFVANAQATSPYSIGKDSVIRTITIDIDKL